MSRPLVLATDSGLPGDGGARALLEEAGCELLEAQCASAEEVIAVAGEAVALIVQWAPITAAVLAAAPRLRLISRLGIGVDMIDVEAATARGVAVCNNPDYCIEEVALHTLALALAGLRSVAGLDRAVRDGRWEVTADAPVAVRPSRTTALVVGFGRIGSAVATGLAAAGLRVLVHDPHVPATRIEAAGCAAASLADGLAAADLVTLHAPLTDGTRHLLDTSRIATMRPGAYVVNTCRGGLIDEAALTRALADGRLGGAALDVFEQEPLPADSLLRMLPNVLLSPHGAWYSPQALIELPRRAAAHVADFLAGREVATILNPGYRDAQPAEVES